MTDIPKLDRVPHYDPRNENHLLLGESILAGGAALPPEVLHKRQVWLDQGKEGACTGFGSAHALSLAPKVSRDLTDANARWIYQEAKKADEWPGENYEGSSVLGAMRALKADGVITSYKWCISMADIMLALTTGSVVVGTQFYAGMARPDDHGLVTPSGSLLGGHCYCLGGYTTEGDVVMFRIDNSWGRDWGQDGSAWIKLTDLRTLLSSNGDAATFVKAAKFTTPIGTA